ncbi:TIGR02679 domain-containing protein [Fusobacterium sp. THCT1E2]
MLDECIRYFKENKGYKRIFQQLKDKYMSYGKLSGNIVIDNPEKIEVEAIKGLLGRVMEGNKIKFKISEFEKVLKKSRFSQIELMELLEGYFSESLITKKEKKIEKEMSKELFFAGIKERLKVTGEYNKATAELLEKIARDKGSFYKHNTDNTETENIIYFTIKAINFLKKSKNKIKIAILGAEITSNPHYFDRGMPAGQLLLNLLFHIHSMEYTKETEKVLELYYISGIEVDTISSFTSAFGISLYTEKGIHQAYEEFIKQSEEYIITMSNLKKVIKADCKRKKVFIVENQMVFSYLCEYFKDKEVALLCTSGQLKTASLILIDMLCQEGCILYYSGDIDPEGIEIADKLLQRNKSKIIPWCFTLKDYKLSISEKIISEESMKKLEKIKNDCFIELIKEVKKEKRAGYQELILDKMKEDIKKMNWDL